MTPMPPCCAMQMAVAASVTVSIAADAIGVFEPDPTRERRRDVGLTRQEIWWSSEKDVVERQALADVEGLHVDSSGAWLHARRG